MNGVFLIRTGPCYSCSCVILTHSIVNLRQSVRTYRVSLVVIITLNKHCATAAIISLKRQYQLQRRNDQMKLWDMMIYIMVTIRIVYIYSIFYTVAVPLCSDHPCKSIMPTIILTSSSSNHYLLSSLYKNSKLHVHIYWLVDAKNKIYIGQKSTFATITYLMRANL